MNTVNYREEVGEEMNQRFRLIKLLEWLVAVELSCATCPFLHLH